MWETEFLPIVAVMYSSPESRGQQLRAAAELAGAVAHDLNNIVTSLLAYTQFVLEGLPEDSPVRRDAAEVQRAGEQAAALAQRLLVFGRHRIEPEPLDLNQIVLALKHRPTKRISIETTTGVAAIRVDREQLHTALRDLIATALAASEEGGVLIGVEKVVLRGDLPHPAGNVPAGRYVLLRLDHSGNLTPGSVKRLQELHFGGPLSLGLVHGMLQHAGGHLVIESGRGGRTEYRLYFPAVQAAEIAAVRPAS